MRYFILLVCLTSWSITAQSDQKLYDIIDTISEERIKNDVKTLADDIVPEIAMANS